ncbi:major facilitator superfamily domain-containing protein [Calycina marina]|uniref:Major facilitator superfamily domain-containing protein n=1 Tax=Calycina marina TaxID=1763456 RepID=A0A9P7Z7M6_9HELO|nr:major facilitator superfamily domain-containing protein [Calycina marina]
MGQTDDQKGAKCAGAKVPNLTFESPLSHPKVKAQTLFSEGSPLLSPPAMENEEEEGLMREDPMHGDSTQKPYDKYHETKGLLYIILLTISIGGLQLAWAVELSNGTPYLLSLGLSKSLMALVWIAGPLSGALVQPYVGILSDNCRSPYGKRSPFMVGGGIATIISLLLLAWVREIVGGFFGLFGADRESEGVKITIIVFAVLFIYMVDFAINTVQAAIRAFILDCCPHHQQESANSMASRVVGIGNILGFICGFVDLPKHVWFFGRTQFQILCTIACIALASTVILSLSTIRERDASLEPPPIEKGAGLLSLMKQVVSSIKRLPPQTRKVCEVQFMAWIGFFPQLFYSSSYVGDIYVQPYLEANPNMTPVQIDALYEKATRVGTFALLIYAITSLSTNVLLPFFINPTYDAASQNSDGTNKCYDTATQRFTANILKAIVIPWLTIRRAWMFSHMIFAGCMFSTLFVTNVAGATAIIGIVGVSWAMTLWAPFAIISAEVSKRDALRRARGIETDEEDQAGVILGLHNMAIATPQIIATILSSIVFKFLQKPRGMPGDHSIAIVLAGGGISTLVAAFLTLRIKDEVEIPDTLVEEGSEVPLTSERGRRSSELVRSGSMSGLSY